MKKASLKKRLWWWLGYHGLYQINWRWQGANRSVFCFLYGHSSYLIMPNPQAVQCRYCLKYKELPYEVDKETYAKGEIKNGEIVWLTLKEKKI